MLHNIIHDLSEKTLKRVIDQLLDIAKGSAPSDLKTQTFLVMEKLFSLKTMPTPMTEDILKRFFQFDDQILSDIQNEKVV